MKNLAKTIFIIKKNKLKEILKNLEVRIIFRYKEEKFYGN